MKGPNLRNFVRETMQQLKSKNYVGFRENVSNILTLKSKNALTQIKREEAKKF